MVTYKWVTVMVMVLCLTISGCSAGRSNQGGASSGHGLMAGFDQNIVSRDGDSKKGSEAHSDDFSTEVRHWKYQSETSNPAPTNEQSIQPVQPVDPTYSQAGVNDADDGKVVSMQFLGVEDLEEVQEILVTEGYLTAKTRDQAAFSAAVAQFQSAHQLNPSGVLDSDTLVLLKKTGHK